ncbi:PD40 domain-containing protein [Winogradskyella sp. DF17]|uniref:PD40 domain-containing protein n=1 Tax=Winogradskyella pelagia TaxID=2819984 RepID=A0ABS3SZX6_9FLAO|nr:PD40 domain-containing protein [Winogradskyella sp. DF17]MBO3116042.1 PD40 domain-containing protein [Winogradskyella sp. DF17]
MKTSQITSIFLLITTLCFSQRNEVEVKNLSLNSDLDHFAARQVGDVVYYSHNLTTKRGRPIKDKYSGFVYTMYTAKPNSNGELIDSKPIDKTELGQFNMSAATFSKDGKFMYFTTNHSGKGTNKLKGITTYNLLIQRAEYEEGKGWTNFTALPFCDPNNNFAHPALSPDGRTLYFIADIRGTKGKSDLYKVSVSSEHENYGEIIKLNETINSSRTEIFPFVSADNKLYFSSDRRGGKGGLDIYSYDLNSVDEQQVPVSLEEPINSKGDDFSFFLNDDSTTGYLSSRRLKGEGGDDLYYFFNF